MLQSRNGLMKTYDDVRMTNDNIRESVVTVEKITSLVHPFPLPLFSFLVLLLILLPSVETKSVLPKSACSFFWNQFRTVLSPVTGTVAAANTNCLSASRFKPPVGERAEHQRRRRVRVRSRRGRKREVLLVECGNDE